DGRLVRDGDRWSRPVDGTAGRRPGLSRRDPQGLLRRSRSGRPRLPGREDSAAPGDGHRGVRAGRVSGERGEVPVTSRERPPSAVRDVVVEVKFKLSALWIATMFCYVYGDFFSLFVPGRIESVVDGRMGIGSTTPENLLAGAVVMIVPSLMIVLSIVLRPRWSQWLNIVLGTVYTLMMLA